MNPRPLARAGVRRITCFPVCAAVLSATLFTILQAIHFVNYFFIQQLHSALQPAITALIIMSLSFILSSSSFGQRLSLSLKINERFLSFVLSTAHCHNRPSVILLYEKTRAVDFAAIIKFHCSLKQTIF